MTGAVVAAKPASAKFELTAAVASAKVIAVVTLNWTGRSLRLVPSACLVIELDDCELGSLHMAAGEVERFLVDRNIGQLIIQRGAYAGKRQAARSNLDFETALELTQLLLARVHTNGVSGWTAHNYWLLPLPQPHLRGRHRSVQARAIEAASYAASRILVERVKQTQMPRPSRQRWAT